jgi:UDP-N-acetylglucosamine--N-acetylmuramyl-(pentapeptide) pyrophosphoryl-undecaprenol N-acetylglucosamine transferase
MTRVLFTGGGTAGHVTPNIALIEAVSKLGWQIDYAGSRDGIECEMITRLGVSFHHVASGKLRRYFSWQNFIDPIFVILGIFQALWLCIRIRPNLVFSKGGFVAVPVVVAAWLLRVPVISHESDVTPGLANKLAYPFSRKICVTFDATTAHLPVEKTLVTGTPVRASLLAGERKRGLSYLGFADSKPVLLVFGGSLGAAVINNAVRSNLDELLVRFNIAHIVGANNIDTSRQPKGYLQKEFVTDAFGDVLAAASVVLCRAGANTLYELFTLRKPHLLIPLSAAASRGDQLVNASTFEKEGFSRVILEEALTDERLLDTLEEVFDQRDDITRSIERFAVRDSVKLIVDEMTKLA